MTTEDADWWRRTLLEHHKIQELDRRAFVTLARMQRAQKGWFLRIALTNGEDGRYHFLSVHDVPIWFPSSRNEKRRLWEDLSSRNYLSVFLIFDRPCGEAEEVFSVCSFLLQFWNIVLLLSLYCLYLHEGEVFCRKEVIEKLGFSRKAGYVRGKFNFLTRFLWPSGFRRKWDGIRVVCSMQVKPVRLGCRHDLVVWCWFRDKKENCRSDSDDVTNVDTAADGNRWRGFPAVNFWIAGRISLGSTFLGHVGQNDQLHET